jgi:hypothetical protein
MQNNCYWSLQNLYRTHDIPLHPVEVGVCCALSARYVQVILGQSFSELAEEERLYGWFQQDSATTHTACMSVHAGFGQCLRGENYQQWYLASTFTWSNPCDFFFWGCLKDKVCSNNPRTEELKENIRREISNIPAEHLPPVQGMSTCGGTKFSDHLWSVKKVTTSLRSIRYRRAGSSVNLRALRVRRCVGRSESQSHDASS